MKKKSFAWFLSFSLLLSTANPVMANAEVSSDPSDGTEILMEETESDVLSDTQVSEEEIVVEDPVEEETGDVIIDSVEDDSPVAEVAVQEMESEKEPAPSEEAWTELEEQNIKYRYVDTTLYIELIDADKPQVVKNYSGPASGPWAVGENDTKAKNVSKIVIKDGITEIGDKWFYSLSGYVFQNLTEVTLPTSVKRIGSCAFDGDKNLSTIELKNIEIIDSLAFQNVKALSKISLDKANSIGSSAFSGCESLQCDAIPNVTIIKEGTFKNCASITQMSLDKVKSIEKSVFSGCTSLKYISFGQADVQVVRWSFLGTTLSAVCYPGTKSEWEAICSADKTTLKNISLDNVHCKGEAVAEAKEPTCTEAGVELRTCAICKGVFNAEIAALGHEFAEDDTVDKVATCTEEGERSKHCIHAGCEERDDIQPIPIDKENHDWVSEVTTWSTCIRDGVNTLTCSRCKETKTETIPATGVHHWSNWKKITDATVFAAEQQERSCTDCGKKETRTVGKNLTATASVTASSVTLKEKQNTSFVKVIGLAKGDSVKTWKSSNTKVFTVAGKADGTCKLTGVKKGTARLEITLASGLKKTVTVKVQVKTVTTTGISGLAKKMTVKKGTKTSLKPVITPITSQQKVTYSSSNKSVATVSSNGVITGKKAGTAKITVKSGSKKATVTITVPRTKTTALTVGEKVSVKKGRTYSLKAKAVPSNSDEKITYATSNKKIATVSKSGKIKGIKKGTATITVKSGKITKKVTVTVK